MRHLTGPVLFMALFWAGCETNPENDTGRPDPHSFSEPGTAQVTHLRLDLQVEFEERILQGTATWEIAQDSAAELVLDTRSMDILEVRFGEDPEPKPFKLGQEDKHLGRALRIPLTPGVKEVTVAYRTKPDAEALQWLNPREARQETPFLFTQSQAILARTWIPCQDSPGIRFTYDARIRVPIGLTALMSAKNPTMESPTGEYFFRMTQPIPSYLMALAAGKIAYRPYERRAGIYAQPDMVLSAAWEFYDTERMMDSCEVMFGPYRWERYDILLMPPSFPFGGMENPRLSFITPSVLAGDRSLTAIIAHELAHSWSGNLVTNATWNDFWMNEGFTVYLERRIMESLYGTELMRMQEQLGYQDLQRAIAEIGAGHPDTKLKGDLAGRDPDEAMTDIPYEKGYFFLRYLEELYGRPTLDKVLNAWFAKKAFQAATTEEFLAFLREGLPDKGTGAAIDEWVYGTGIPKSCPVPRSTRFEAIDRLVQAGPGVLTGSLDTAGWSAMEWLHLLRHLPKGADLGLLDRQYGFSDSDNAEYKAAWFEHCIREGHVAPVTKPLSGFLQEVGRRKYLTPLYTALLDHGHKALAKDIYGKARDGYHPVSRMTIDELFAEKG